MSKHCHELICAIYYTFEVRWGLENEPHVIGSIDKAISEQFPEYTSRRYSHWKKQYHKFNWEAVPDTQASKISQLPNSFRSAVGCKLKGPGMSSYFLPKPIEDEMEKYRAGNHLLQLHYTLYMIVFWYCKKYNTVDG